MTDRAEQRLEDVAVDSAGVRRSRFGRRALALGLAYFAVADLGLLPMFHISGVPIKLAYGALLLATVILIGGRRAALPANQKALPHLLLIAILAMALTSLIGYCITDAIHGIGNFVQTGRQMIVFVLVMAAFWVGTQIRGFRWGLVECVLWLHGILILVLCWAPEAAPWLTQMWWKTTEGVEMRLRANEGRPTPFGDNSMLVMNILFLGVALAVRHASYRLISPIITIGLTIVVSLVLASRNQMIVTAILTAVLLSTAAKGGLLRVCIYGLVAVGLCGVLLLIVPNLAEWAQSAFAAGGQAIGKLQMMFDGTAERVDSIERPLHALRTFEARFVEGPIFGTGYSVGPMPPFDYMNLHNDFFWVFAASGLVGGVAYLVLIFCVYRALGVLAILPFFLPGLTNSLLMHVTACLLLFFFVGVLSTRLTKKSGDMTRVARGSSGIKTG